LQPQEILIKEVQSEEVQIEAIEITPNLSYSYRLIKRTMDIVGSLFLLTVLSPLLLLIIILVKIEDPRASVLFKQLRTGKNGKPFYCYKFRTMIQNADDIKSDLMKLNEMDGPVFKIKNDPRITKLGKILRRYSLDELVQLINVLTNKMSLVGPRPLPVKEAAGCNARQKLRELVKPGLVCYWQVSGRNELSFEQWMELDIQYIQDMSFWTDCKILVKTFSAVLSKKGAY